MDGTTHLKNLTATTSRAGERRNSRPLSQKATVGSRLSGEHCIKLVTVLAEQREGTLEEEEEKKSGKNDVKLEQSITLPAIHPLPNTGRQGQLVTTKVGR